MGLTTKQELFSKLVALDGLSASEAYRQIYDSNPSNQSSIHEQSSKLMSNSKVSTRIKELSEAVTSRLVWDKAKIVSELAVNVELAREHKQMAASNRSLELVARITGSLVEEPKQVTGTVSVIHSLSDEVLEQLAAMAAPEPDAIVPEADTIEASYKLLDPEP